VLSVGGLTPGSGSAPAMAPCASAGRPQERVCDAASRGGQGAVDPGQGRARAASVVARHGAGASRCVPSDRAFFVPHTRAP
jgi:hypothetical protein